MLETFKKFLSRLNYSHWGNLKSLSDISVNQREELFFIIETKNKLVSDYRSAHMSIVAGVIAFLGFLWKDEVIKHPNIYSWFWLFIFGSILFLVAWYYIDSIFLSKQIHITSSNLSWVKKAVDEIKNIKFGNEEKNLLLNSQRIFNKWVIYIYNFIVFISGITIWILFFIWVYNFLNYA